MNKQERIVEAIEFAKMLNSTLKIGDLKKVCRVLTPMLDDDDDYDDSKYTFLENIKMLSNMKNFELTDSIKNFLLLDKETQRDIIYSMYLNIDLKKKSNASN